MIEIPVTDKSYTLYKLTNKYHNHNAMQIVKTKLDNRHGVFICGLEWWGAGGGRVAQLDYHISTSQEQRNIA